MKFIFDNCTEAFPASLEPSLSWELALKLLPSEFCESSVYHGNPDNRLSYRLMTSTSDLPIFFAKAFWFLFGKELRDDVPVICYDCNDISLPLIRNSRSSWFVENRCVVSDHDLTIEMVDCGSRFELYFYKV